MKYKIISAISDIIGILAVSILFIMNFKNECFKLDEWYLTLLPILLSYIAQFLAMFEGDLNEK